MKQKIFIVSIIFTILSGCVFSKSSIKNNNEYFQLPKHIHSLVDSTNQIVELIYISMDLEEYKQNAIDINQKYPEQQYNITNHYTLLSFSNDEDKKFIVTYLLIIPKDMDLKK